MPSTIQTQNQEQLLGTDIAHDAQGNWLVAFKNGYHDLANIKGNANLKQAILSRLRAEAKQLGSRLNGSLPAHNSYGVGIFNLISAPTLSVIQTAKTRILDNLNQEPRIKPIQVGDINITFDNSTRQVFIEITFTPIGQEIPQNIIFPIYIR